MRYRFFSILTLLVFFQLTSFAQSSLWDKKIKRTTEIVFDTGGRMISYPPTIVWKNSTLCFKVKAPIGFIRSQIDKLKSNLTLLNDSLQSGSIGKAYDCFFAEFDLYGAYKKSLKQTVDLLDKGSACDEKFISHVKSMEFPQIPIASYFKNIMEKQFELKIFKGNTCIKTIPLIAITKDCKDSCIYFESNTCEKINSLECQSCTVDDQRQVKFQLIWNDPWNKTVMDWYNAEIKKVKYSKDEVDKIFKAITDAGNTVDCKLYTNALVDLKNNTLKSWFVNWFWYSAGKLVLDPFHSLTKKKQEEYRGLIKAYDATLKNLQYLDKYYDSAMNKVDETKRNESELIFMKDLYIKNLGEIATTKQSRDEFQSKLDGNGELINTLRTVSILYEGKLVVSSLGNINPQKQFDAIFDYNPITLSSRDRVRVTEIPEDEKMQLLIQNVDASVKTILVQKRLDFDDLEEFTRLVSEQLSKIEAISFPADNISGMQDFIKSFLNKDNTYALSGSNWANIKCNSNCLEIQPYLAVLSKEIENGIVTFPPNPDLFNKLATTGPRFRTDLTSASIFEAPYRDSITIREIVSKDSVRDVGKTYVKVGKLRYFQLAAGMAFTSEPSTVTTIDTAGGGVKVSSQDNKATPIIGFKFYPFKNYNRDNSLIPRYPLRRISMFAGFEILHPLNNFYLGGSYDVVPGLALSIGKNYYLQTTYKVENNAVTNTSRSYNSKGVYYSVSVNPTLFVQIVKLFFKSI